MRLRALRPWYNSDHEGHIDVNQFFDAGEYRAGELIRAGLAEVALEEGAKIRVTADPPPVAVRPAVKRTKRA